jgi:hypothetical protein
MVLTVELPAAGGSSTVGAASAVVAAEGAVVVEVPGGGDGVKDDKEDEGELGAVVGVELPCWPASAAMAVETVEGGAEVEAVEAGAGDSSEGEMM